MNEQFNHNPSDVPDQTGTDVVSLLKKMQQQLLFLEKKIDILINQSQEKPFREKLSPKRPFRKRPFSKPLRSFGHSHRQGKEEHERSPRKKDSAQGRHSEHRQRDEDRGFSPKKKPFSYKRKDRE